MKKLWLIPFVLILLAVAVNAKCGDNFCDIKEAEDCESCPDDCLCTLIKYESVSCCNDFTCKECEKGYCKDRKCSTLEGFTSIFKKVECFDNGSVNMEIKFNELDSTTLTPNEDLKVYMKEKSDETSFKEISGTWFNPSREGDYRYTKIADTSRFTSDKDLFKLEGDYYIRVKYKIGRSYSIFEDTEVSCPGIPAEPTSTTQEEPEAEEVEPPREEFIEEAEEPKEEVTEDKEEEPETLTEKPQEKSYLVWYIITGIIILALIIFFVKYEIRVAKKL